MNFLDSLPDFIKSQSVFSKKWMDSSDTLLNWRDQIKNVGMPTRQMEYWRQTSLKFLKDMSYGPTPSWNHVPEKLKQELLALKSDQFTNLIVLNGQYAADLSDGVKGLTVSLVTEVPAATSAVDANQYFKALNEIYSPQKIKLNIEKELTKPIQIISYSSPLNGAAVMVSPKIEVNIFSKANSEIIFNHASQSLASIFVNSEIVVNLDTESECQILEVTRQSANANHFENIVINQNAKSKLKYLELNLNSQQIRRELELNLNGPESESDILGANYLSGHKVFGNYTHIKHHHSHCRSEQKYKSLLDDESQSIFSGRVYIGKNIEKADSAQLNQNLLLSDKAEVNSRPILNIFSDDVKASHGSTIGQINDEEIFYLQSRAIPKKKAIELLSSAFLNEVILKLSSKSRGFALDLLNQEMAADKMSIKVLK